MRSDIAAFRHFRWLYANRGTIRYRVRNGRNRMSDALPRLYDLTDEIRKPRKLNVGRTRRVTMAGMSLSERVIRIQRLRPERLTTVVLL